MSSATSYKNILSNPNRMTLKINIIFLKIGLHSDCQSTTHISNLTAKKHFFVFSKVCIINRAYFQEQAVTRWTHKSAKNYHRALISPLLPRAAFSDRALWRHHNWSVTSCEREILVLWRHICLLLLYAQIGAKPIFTSELQPWISISRHPVFMA